MLNPPLFQVGNVTLDIIRTEETTYVNGRAVAGTSSTVQVVANVQPIQKMTDTMNLPEGDRSKATLKIYTKGAEIRQKTEGAGGWEADRFVFEGDTYEVLKVIHYSMGILNHYKALCGRVELT